MYGIHCVKFQSLPFPGACAVATVQSSELAEQLSSGGYNCMVCCERVWPRQDVWSCGGCFHVFHLKCISRWARAPAAVLNESACVCVCLCVYVCVCVCVCVYVCVCAQ